MDFLPGLLRALHQVGIGTYITRKRLRGSELLRLRRPPIFPGEIPRSSRKKSAGNFPAVGRRNLFRGPKFLTLPIALATSPNIGRAHCACRD